MRAHLVLRNGCEMDSLVTKGRPRRLKVSVGAYCLYVLLYLETTEPAPQHLVDTEIGFPISIPCSYT